MAFVGHVVAVAPGRAARGLQIGRIGMDRLPAPERIPGRETVAAAMDELDRTVAAEIVDGPGIPVDADIAQGRRLALHDGTAARMRPDMDVMRRHHGNQRPAEPGRPPSIRVMPPCRRRGDSPGWRKTAQAGPCRPQESVGSGGVTSGRENRCEPGIRAMSCQGTPWIARLLSARGIWRDPVRSSHGHFVKTSGLRWLSFMLLTPLPWLPGIKALPIMTLLAPSARWARQKGRRHKPLTERARQGMLVILRWLPGRSVIFVGDSSFGTHELADAIGRRACLISRLRLDANLFEAPEQRRPGQMGRPRQKGRQLPKLGTCLADGSASWTPVLLSRWYGGLKDRTLEILSGKALWYRAGAGAKPIRWVLVRDPEGVRDPRAFFSTDPDMDPARIIAIFVRRRQIETTFQEARAHPGVETRRQWSDAAIERTTPVLPGLCSLVCLWATDLPAREPHSDAAAWWRKSAFTFSDAIAAVRCRSWLDGRFQRSPPDREWHKTRPPDPVDHAGSEAAARYGRLKVPPERVRRMVETLCHAA